MKRKSIEELRAIHAKKLYEKNGDILQASKAKHGNKNLRNDFVFNPQEKGNKHLQDNADMIMKYSVDPYAKFKTDTPISLKRIGGHDPHDYEPSDNMAVQKYLYKGSGKIIEMTPDEFLKLASPIARYNMNENSLKHLRENMGKTSGEIPQLAVQSAGQHSPDNKVTVMSHEGRHRAFVAKEKGLEKIPVLISSTHSDHPLSDKDIHAISRHEFLPERR